MPRIYNLSVIKILFIKYFKFQKKKAFICAEYSHTERGQKLSMIRKLNLKFLPGPISVAVATSETQSVW